MNLGQSIIRHNSSVVENIINPVAKVRTELLRGLKLFFSHPGPVNLRLLCFHPFTYYDHAGAEFSLGSVAKIRGKTFKKSLLFTPYKVCKVSMVRSVMSFLSVDVEQTLFENVGRTSR